MLDKLWPYRTRRSLAGLVDTVTLSDLCHKIIVTVKPGASFVTLRFPRSGVKFVRESDALSLSGVKARAGCGLVVDSIDDDRITLVPKQAEPEGIVRITVPSLACSRYESEETGHVLIVIDGRHDALHWLIPEE